jgi:hypothetical protein
MRDPGSDGTAGHGDAECHRRRFRLETQCDLAGVRSDSMFGVKKLAK